MRWGVEYENPETKKRTFVEWWTVGGQPFLQKVGERLDLLRRHCQPRRHRMAAAGDEQAAVLRRQHRSAEIDARNRTARALAHAVIAKRDDDGRPMELLLQTAGDDADHARVPALGGEHERVALGVLRHQRLRLETDPRLDVPAFGVDQIEFGGRKGFVKLALDRGVPIVPIVALGGQETALFLTRGEGVARATGWADLTRIKVLPVALIGAGLVGLGLVILMVMVVRSRGV